MRRATAADAATIADIQILLWQQAFAELLPAGVVFTDPVQHAVTWDARLRQGGPVLLALEGAAPVGFAAVSSELDDRNLLAPIGEIEVLYVVPRWGRRGHGGRLLAGAAAELRRIGCHLRAVVDPGERQGQHDVPGPGGMVRRRCPAGVGHRRGTDLRGAILGQRGPGCRLNRVPHPDRSAGARTGSSQADCSVAQLLSRTPPDADRLRPSSSLGNQISRAISTNAAAAGIATKAPTMPSNAAPISTATTVIRAGTLTALPISLGTST